MEDAAGLAEALNNKNIIDNFRDGIPYPYTENDAKRVISTRLCADKKSAFSFAIVQDNRVVGCIRAFRQDNIHFRTAEMGYCIAQAFWGRGIRTSAVKQACGYIFVNTDIIRIFAEPFPEILPRAAFSKNPASRMRGP